MSVGVLSKFEVVLSMYMYPAISPYIPEYYAHKCIKKCTSINKHFERHHFMKNKSVSVLLKDNVLKMQI